MTRLPAFAVDGALASGRLLRTVAYASTSGMAGIVTPESMKVTANGAAVSIGPGAAVIPTRYVASPAYNSYVVTADASESLAIPATGSGGGATRYIIARIDDPEYGGQGDAQGIFWRYEQVSSITNLAYPFIALARINQPASTTTITAGMITDLRQVATPRVKPELRVLNLPVGVTDRLTNTTPYPGGQTFPQAATDAWGPIDIPTWATRVKIVMTWSSLKVPPGNVTGHLWVQIGLNTDPDKIVTQASAYDTLGLSQYSRDTIVHADEVLLPPAVRGTSKRFYPRGAVSSASAGSPQLEVASTTAMILQLEFLETPA